MDEWSHPTRVPKVAADDPGDADALKLLLVEDSPSDARLVIEALRDADGVRFEVTHVERLSDALARVHDATFDVVLIDLSLPDSLGEDTMLEVQRTAPSLPVVVLSGHDDDDLGMRLVEAGAQDYLVKGQTEGPRLGRALRFAVSRKRAEERLKSIAQLDPLTGLANRSLFEDRLDGALARARRHGSSAALVFLDLDRFKTVNDSYGHAIGDRLLCEVADRLRGAVRDTDTVARLGGDEFTVLLEDVGTRGDAARVAEKMIAAFAEPVQLGGMSLSVTASIGIAMFPESAPDAATLVRRADHAMYLAKQSGRNRFRFHEPIHLEPDERTVEREQLLLRALAHDELRLLYQPVFDLATQRVVTVEALVRWQSEGSGYLVAASEFLPIADRAGIVGAVGEWSLRAACDQLARWRLVGIESVRVAVNLLPGQVLAADLPETIERILAETHVEPGMLDLEVPASTLLDHRNIVAPVLARLREQGFRITVDHLTEPETSSAVLEVAEVDALKLHPAAVMSALSEPAQRAALERARARGVTLIGEGIETRGQLEALSRLGVELAQGFLLARPRRALALESSLRGDD
ncbi:MAG: diguanylate cyclase [Ectothiorhodospiraceae bacterium]|nr:diguanylate cyclase [Chromatiales bacterium]MCP5154399.1 diguanylate cyclase [Ectothiorhodospiraceae bacterium]